jgi:hypothetical protein
MPTAHRQMDQLDELPERSRMLLHSGMPESFRAYLRQRWEAGCRHGRSQAVRDF